MPPQAYWRGQFQLSLVTFPVRLHAAVGTAGGVTLNQLHGIPGCYRRIRHERTCPDHGPVPAGEIAKGYEVEKGRYVVIDDADLRAIKLPTTRTLEIIQFIDAAELDAIYQDRPYYMAPDSKAGQTAYRVVREAVRQSGKIGIGRVVFLGRERYVSVAPHGDGFRVFTLRYAPQIRKPEDAFSEVRDGDVDKTQLGLASQLIDQYSEPFDPNRFQDRYASALMEIVNAKAAGAEPVAAEQPSQAKVINLMKALQESVEQARKVKKPPAKSIRGAKGKRGKGTKGA